MKKIFLAIAACCLFAASSYAQDKLFVNSKSGQSTAYSLSEIKKIVFSGENMAVVTEASEASYVILEVSTITFTDPTGIESVQSDAQPFVTYSQSNRDELLLNCAPGATVQVFGANGQLVKQVKVENGSLNVGSLGAGMYIIKSNNQTAKIIKL